MTINPYKKPQNIINETVFEHPIYSIETLKAQKEVIAKDAGAIYDGPTTLYDSVKKLMRDNRGIVVVIVIVLCEIVMVVWTKHQITHTIWIYSRLNVMSVSDQYQLHEIIYL